MTNTTRTDPTTTFTPRKTLSAVLATFGIWGFCLVLMAY